MNIFKFKTKADQDSPRIQAVRWLERVETNDLTAGAAQELARWIAASPENEAAWQKVQATAAFISENAGNSELMALRSEALAYRREPSDRLVFGIAAGIGVAVLAGSVFWFALTAVHHGNVATPAEQVAAASAGPENGAYQTIVGERSTLTLSDGSIITLDTNSSVRVAYNDASRTVYLQRGQAIFNVAKHKKIPFDVFVGDRKITAIGTLFDVRLEGSAKLPAVRVALVEGKIRVSKTASDGELLANPETIIMRSGEVLTARPMGPTTVRTEDTNALTSWRTGILHFSDERLGDAVKEMNRYTNRPIILGQAKLADLKVSGTFKSGDPDYFAASIAEAFPIRVAHNGDGSPVLMSK